MRKLVFAAFFLISASACSLEISKEETEVDQVQNQEPPEIQGPSERQEDSEEEPQDQEQQQSAQDNLSNENESTQDEESSEDEAHIDNADEIFQKSADAMASVKSMYVEGTRESDSIVNEVERQERVHIYSELMLEEPTTFYQTTTIEATNEPITEMQMYKTEDHYFIEEKGKWNSYDVNTEIFSSLYDLLDPEAIRNFENYSSLFYVEENENSYKLSYSGSDQEFKDVVFESGHMTLHDFFNDFYHNMNVTGTYELTINKQTYHLMSYRVDFIANTSGVAGEGEVYENSTFSFSRFNELGGISVPEQVLEVAEEK